MKNLTLCFTLTLLLVISLILNGMLVMKVDKLLDPTTQIKTQLQDITNVLGG